MSKEYVNRENDEEIIDIIRTILSRGSWEVETIYESILAALMEKRGTPISGYSSCRDIKEDFESWKNGIKTGRFDN